MANDKKWCFAWLAEAASSTGADRAALIRESKWKSGDVITVSFLDGDGSVKERVKKFALKWTEPQMANLTLDFRNNTTDTLVRISFQHEGSWSTVGTTCKQVTNKSQPTMNYGWLTPNSTDEETERVVLHEFGHALGLIHEHQNPTNPIDWNREAVIRDLSGPPNNWPEDVIERNIFEAFKESETNSTSLDAESIMMYPIPASWTNDGFSADLNNTLSQTDRDFIRQQYP